MDRVVSGVKPTGTLNLGGYLGAFRNWVDEQHTADAFYFVADLHALTVEHDPAALRRATLDVATTLLAIGIDPSVATVFVQSEVPAHTALAWLLECTATMGELSRMTQFKDKGRGQDSTRVGLFTYPALMAADILLYRASAVPVGDDQRQHLELTRDLAQRFNHRYGPVFVVPRATVPKLGARIMDLSDPTRKMSKSADSPQGTIDLLDPPDVVRRKLRRAVTDPEREVRYDPATKPGVSNLLELLAAAAAGPDAPGDTSRSDAGRSGEPTEAPRHPEPPTPETLAESFGSYGELKEAVAEAVVALLAPIQERYRDLAADPSTVRKILDAGRERARSVAAETYTAAADAIGLGVA
jgi:tryptophanyl-tRNA synthetase